MLETRRRWWVRVDGGGPMRTGVGGEDLGEEGGVETAFEDDVDFGDGHAAKKRQCVGVRLASTRGRGGSGG